jgi:hypothetical protein
MLKEKDNAMGGQVIIYVEKKENDTFSFRFKLTICVIVHKLLFFFV